MRGDIPNGYEKLAALRAGMVLYFCERGERERRGLRAAGDGGGSFQSL